MLWPFITLSIILSIAGIITRRPLLLWVGAVLAVPFALYLFATPRFGPYGIVLPLFQAGAAYNVRKGAIWAAWLLIAPLTLFSSLLALVVIIQ